MGRKFVDFREFPELVDCTLFISGEEDEVLRVVTEHAVSAHGLALTPELREKIRAMLREELPHLQTRQIA